MATDGSAEEILIAHQRLDRGGCLCGWDELGKSHPGHQVAMLRGARAVVGWQEVERQVRERLTEALRVVRRDAGAYYDLAKTARVLADEITTLWLNAEQAELDRLRAALAGAEQATTDARQLQLQREELLLMCDSAELVGNGLIPAGEIRKAFARTRALAADVPAAVDHEHPGGYLSTACLHELHEPECGAAQRARGDNSHPHCKYCGAKCVCPCHTGGQVERAERVHADGCTLAADDPHHAGWCELAVGDVRLRARRR